MKQKSRIFECKGGLIWENTIAHGEENQSPGGKGGGRGRGKERLFDFYTPASICHLFPFKQLDRLEANKAERAMKMELAHSNKCRSIDREKAEIEKEKVSLEKKLEGKQIR